MVTWTEERVAALRELWESGLSASRIATELGGVTRNSIIGKAHRLGLSGRIKSRHGESAGANKGSSANVAGCSNENKIRAESFCPKNHVSASGNSSEENKILPISTAEIVKSSNDSLESDLPLIENAGVLQLTEQTCKWPIGDPGEEGFHFCCRRTNDGSPYCDYHARCAYQTVERRRDKRLAV